MPEREPPPKYLLPISDIRAKLDATHDVGRDPILGAKHTFALPEDAGTLAVFPTAGITRVETPNALVQVAAYPRVDTTDDAGITLDLSGGGGEASLTLHPDGTVLFSRVPGATERPTQAPETTRSTDAPLAHDVAPKDHHSAKDVPADRTTRRSAPADGRPPSETPAISKDPDANESEPRVQLTGRLGRNPTFRTSPRGTHIGTFSLAVHDQDGATTWHSIVAFGARADQLHHRVQQGELGKGQEVNVVGYQHAREQPTKTGSRTVTEIHAVAVVKRG